MPRRKQVELPAGVTRLRDQIERWRTTREKRTRMAPELWAEAVALAQGHGAYPVARALRVNFEALKRRMSETAAAPSAPPVHEFVELAPQSLAAPSTTGAVVELVDGKARVVMRLPEGATLDVARVLCAFFGRGA